MGPGAAAAAAAAAEGSRADAGVDDVVDETGVAEDGEGGGRHCTGVGEAETEDRGSSVGGGGAAAAGGVIEEECGPTRTGEEPNGGA